MIQKIINFLNPVSPEDLRTLRASLEDIRALQTSLEDFRTRASSEDFRSLLRVTLDQHVPVNTSDSVQCIDPVPVLAYDYTYLVINTGHTNAAVAYLQVSPDGTAWETQSATKTISPDTVVSFVPNVIAYYSRLCYQSKLPGHSTPLTIYTQGRT
jgi:hypothetical protein